MSDLNSLLSSVGLDNSASSEPTRPRRIAPRRAARPAPPPVEETPQESQPEIPQEEIEPTVLTNDDYCDILENAGLPCNLEDNEESEEDLSSFNPEDVVGDNTFHFPDGTVVTPITVTRENNTEEDEERDLDAEEDEEWERLQEEGIIRPVDTPAPIVVTTGTDVVFHVNGEEISVPITSGPADVQRSAVVQAYNELQEQELSNEESTPTPEASNTFIPQNSSTFLMDESTARFSGAEWYNEIQKTRVILAGLGGIGSWVALQLARMVPERLVLYDDDRVERVNMAGQLYCSDDIGKYKSSAIENMISKYTSMQDTFAINEKFLPESEPGDIMMCGFDNMEARKVFFYSWRAHVLNKAPGERRKCLFIDGRLTMNELQVLCISGEDIHNMNRYEREFLFDSSEAEHTVCSMKQTTYLAAMIGSFMVNLFTNWVANQLNPIIPYDVPFFTSYDAQNMLLNFER